VDIKKIIIGNQLNTMNFQSDHVPSRELIVFVGTYTTGIVIAFILRLIDIRLLATLWVAEVPIGVYLNVITKKRAKKPLHGHYQRLNENSFVPLRNYFLYPNTNVTVVGLPSWNSLEVHYDTSGIRESYYFGNGQKHLEKDIQNFTKTLLELEQNSHILTEEVETYFREEC
jgi:hypothetical protein